jgi:hypothetical protein
MRRFIILILLLFILPTAEGLIGARQVCNKGVVLLYSPGGTGKPGGITTPELCEYTLKVGIEEAMRLKGYSNIEAFDLYRDYGLFPLDMPFNIPAKAESAVLGVADMFEYMSNEKFLDQAQDIVDWKLDEGKCVIFFGRSNGAAFIIQEMKNKMSRRKYPDVSAIAFGSPEGYGLDEYANSDRRILYWEHPDDWVGQEPNLANMLFRFLSKEPWAAHEYAWGGDRCVHDERQDELCEIYGGLTDTYTICTPNPEAPVMECANFDEVPKMVTEFLDRRFRSISIDVGSKA